MKKRHIIYIALGLMILFGCGLFGLPTQPVLPTIQLPGEVVLEWPGGREFLNGSFGPGLTNTFIATVVTYILIIAGVLALRARSRSADEVPTGFYNLVEMLIDGAYGYVQNAAGRWARPFFPFFMTFVLLILTANWLELVPGVDSIGLKEDLIRHRVEVAEEEAHLAGEELSDAEIARIEEAAASEGGHFVGPLLLRAEDGEAGEAVVPFLRAAATDLNFTFALAVVSVLFTQYFGFRAYGARYVTRFLNWKEKKIARNPLGLMDFIVGILEGISELAKIISFSFRLFGNIFAGQVLLFIIGFLAPVALIGVYGLEFFIGAIQALIFGLLTLTFMAQAATGHHEDDEH
ncbi:MAG: F0F1 ATP synthase subunit A [Candidatus Promineifilaceae bacterium]